MRPVSRSTRGPGRDRHDHRSPAVGRPARGHRRRVRHRHAPQRPPPHRRLRRRHHRRAGRRRPPGRRGRLRRRDRPRQHLRRRPASRRGGRPGPLCRGAHRRGAPSRRRVPRRHPRAALPRLPGRDHLRPRHRGPAHARRRGPRPHGGAGRRPVVPLPTERRRHLAHGTHLPGRRVRGLGGRHPEPLRHPTDGRRRRRAGRRDERLGACGHPGAARRADPWPPRPAPRASTAPPGPTTRCAGNCAIWCW